jgi:hypothetical protein
MKKDIKTYLKKINVLIDGNIVFLKKRLDIFPKKIIKKVSRLKMDDIIEFQDKTYTNRELMKEVLVKYKELNKDSRRFSYSNLSRRFVSDCKLTDEYDEVYDKYKEELTKKLEENKAKLRFCLDALNAMDKSMRNK